MKTIADYNAYRLYGAAAGAAPNPESQYIYPTPTNVETQADQDNTRPIRQMQTHSIDGHVESIRNIAVIGMIAVAFFGLVGSPFPLIGFAATTVLLIHIELGQLVNKAHQQN